MKRLPILFALTISAMAAELQHPLPGPVEAVVRDASLFSVLAASVEREVETRIGTVANTGSAEERLLLGLRVHLALLAGHDDRALAAAARIRALQVDAVDQAYAGLTTQAMVAARGADGEIAPGAFAEDFSRRLAALPMTAAMRAGLVRQRDRMIATTETALLAEARTMGERLVQATTCGLVEADQIIRLRHRLIDLLPLRTAIIEALNAAIAARPAT